MRADNDNVNIVGRIYLLPIHTVSWIFGFLWGILKIGW
jgi:hypothetical protein